MMSGIGEIVVSGTLRGLKPSAVVVLVAALGLAESGKRPTRKELAAATGLHRNTMSAAVRSLKSCPKFVQVCHWA